MSFMDKLKEAETHLHGYEDVAGEILDAAKGGLDKLKAHRDAILASIEAAAATTEKFAQSIVSTTEDAVEPASAPTPAIDARSGLVNRLPAPGADASAQFLGRG